jgi:ADP-heptose:LPS heptosyltransferase
VFVVENIQMSIISRNIRTKAAKLLLDRKNKRSFRFSNLSTIPIEHFKTIVFPIHDDKIGDAVISTIFFREIKRSNSSIKIIVLCGKNSKDVLENNLFVDEILEIKGNIFKDFSAYKTLSKEKNLLVVDFFDMPLKMGQLLALKIISPNFLIGFSKQNYKIYNLSINDKFYAVHISERHKAVLKILGIETKNLNYDIFLTENEEKIAQEQLARSGKNFNIVLNPFGSSKHRTIKIAKLKSLAYEIINRKDCAIFVLCPPGKETLVEEIQNEKKFIFLSKTETIRQVFALIKFCDFVISPDTSVVHIASAFAKKIIGLYLNFSHREEKTDIIWSPNNINAKILKVPDYKSKNENDIENIDNGEIIKMFEEMTQDKCQKPKV